MASDLPKTESMTASLPYPLELREMQRLEAMLIFERALAAQGFLCVAGVDEAGRGPLAGPIVAAAVVLAFPVPGLDDSKKLSAARREQLFEALVSGGHAIGVAEASAAAIDREGIQVANYRVMQEAVARLPEAPDFLLVDGYNLPGAAPPRQRLVKGDSRSLSIAAASIVAKVTRDRIMMALDEQYPGYGFAGHKGYGTRAHLDALRRLGPCPEHRRSFAPLARSGADAWLFPVADKAEPSCE